MVRIFWLFYFLALALGGPIFVNWVLDAIQSITLFVGAR